MITTTLNKLQQNLPRRTDFANLLATLKKTEFDDEPLSFLAILDSDGFDFALKCCASVHELEPPCRLFAVWCARRVEHLILDGNYINAIIAAEQLALGKLSIQNWDYAWRAIQNIYPIDDYGSYADAAKRNAGHSACVAAGLSLARCENHMPFLDAPDSAARAKAYIAYSDAIYASEQKTKIDFDDRFEFARKNRCLHTLMRGENDKKSIDNESALESAKLNLYCRTIDNASSSALLSEKLVQEEKFIEIVSKI